MGLFGTHFPPERVKLERERERTYIKNCYGKGKVEEKEQSK